MIILLTNAQKRMIEYEILKIMSNYPQGHDTRQLITAVIRNLSYIPFLNRHHVAGMLAWILRRYQYKLLRRYPGYMA